MNYFLSILFFSNVVMAADVPQIDCSYEGIKKFCEKANSSKDFKLSNGARFLTADEIKNSKVSKFENGAEDTKYKRFKDLFQKTQKISIDAILKERKIDQLTIEEKELIKRIKTLELEVSSKDMETVCNSNNGYYGNSIIDHKIILCPVMDAYKDSALVFIIGAFIGRSLGECATQFRAKPGLTSISIKSHPFNLKEDKEKNSLMSCVVNGDDPYPMKTSSFDEEKLNAEVNAIKIRAPEATTKAALAAINAFPSC